MSHLPRLFVITLALAISLTAMAQAPGTKRLLDAAPAAQTISAPGVQFSASNDGSSVALKWSKTLASLPEDRTRLGVLPQAAHFTTWALTAEAPISKSDKAGTLFNLDGLGNATTLGVSIYRFTADWKNPTVQEAQELRAICDRMWRAARAKYDLEQEAAKNQFDEAQKDEAVKHEYVQPTYVRPDCTTDTVHTFSPTDASRMPALRPGPQPGGFLYGATAKYGLQESTYYDPTSLAEQKTRNHPWSFGGFVGWVPETWSALFTLKVERKRTFKDADESVMCPASTVFPVACVAGSFGVPTESTGTVVTLDARRFVTSNIAASLAVVKDFGRHTTAVEVPVYWMASADGGLIGGIKLHWNTEDRKARVGLFVGAPFAIFQ